MRTKNAPVALVTGATRGIGLAIAREFAAEGYLVLLVARTASELRPISESIRHSGGGGSDWHAVDVSDDEGVAALYEWVTTHYGTPNVVVNNAGGQHALGPLWESESTEWWDDVELNLRSAYLMMKGCLGPMVDRGFGRVINVVSRLGTQPAPFNSAYGCAKAALISLGESVEMSLRGSGVHVFSLSPGIVRTPGFEDSTLSGAGRRWLPEFANLDHAAMVGPEVAAKMTVRIASGEADDLAGRLIRATWDLDELVADSRQIETENGLVMRLRSWRNWE
jgi:NAD(P)-dependent dehydrogenase (short-subunit alcohol dehydrogenase family)